MIGVEVFSYSGFGLGIHSALPLPELISTEAPADVVIRLGSSVATARPLRPPDTRCSAGNRATATLSFEGVGTFLVRGGNEVVVEPAATVTEQVLRLFLLGPALGV